MIVFVQVAAALLSGFFLPGKSLIITQAPATPPPGPNLETAPQLDFLSLKATQEAKLNSYGWVDKAQGKVHIPINQAMQAVAQQGLPVLAAGGVSPGGGANVPPEQAGASLFQSLGCIGCHGAGSKVAPDLTHLYGSTVTLSNGSQVTADDAYIKESILNPNAKVVQGFAPIMPSFQGKITDQELNDLVSYIKSLNSASP